MSVIGTFQKFDEGFIGSVATLTFRISPVWFVKRDKGPSFSIYGSDDAELGAGWLKAGQFGSFISVRLDGPGLSSPINGIMSLKANENGIYALRWQRREETGATEG
jgi:uncharacterized protein (DUF736 family)